jgi:GT2 family glycosyltransferase
VRRRFPDVRTIVNPSNLGYAGGNNVGIRLALEAGAEYVLLLNKRRPPRARRDRCARRGSRVRDPRIAAVGAKILRADDPRRLWLAWARSRITRAWCVWSAPARATARASRPIATSRGSRGCAILLARGALEAIGALDEEYFAYHEEVDWCARARERGFRVVWAARARVVHRGQASSGVPTYVSRRQYLTARNMVRFVRRHGTPLERLEFAASWSRRCRSSTSAGSRAVEAEGVRLKVRGVRDALPRAADPAPISASIDGIGGPARAPERLRLRDGAARARARARDHRRAGRILPAETFGLYAVVVAYLGVFQVLADLGLESLLVQRFAQAPAERSRLFAAALGLRSATAAAAVALAVALAPLAGVAGAGGRTIVLAGAVALLAMGQPVFRALLRAELRLDSVLAVAVGTSALALALVAGVAAAGAGLVAIFAAAALAQAVGLGAAASSSGRASRSRRASTLHAGATSSGKRGRSARTCSS